MTDSFGARLRHERERRQIALRSIAESTKIGLPLLEGLESDNVSRWPSGIFRKSFVRSYALAIGLDPESIVREFEERHPDPSQAAGHAQEPAPAVTAPAQSLKAIGRRILTQAMARSWKLPTSAGIGNSRPVVVKLTIHSAGSAFTRGRLLGDIRKRWAAAACDAGVSCFIAVGLFPVLGHFWTPLGVSMLCYYLGGILILGNTPGVCLFAPSEEEKHTYRSLGGTLDQ